MSGDFTDKPSKADAAEKPARIDLRDVMKDSREIILVHKGQDYRLRVTSNDKLILTK